MAGVLYRENVEPIAVVQALEQHVPRHAVALGQDRDLGQGLGHHPEQQVVAQLHDAGGFSLAYVGGAVAEHVQVRPGQPERLGGTGYRQRKPAGRGDPRVSHHRGGQQRAAPLREPFPDLLRRFGRHGRAVHHDGRRGRPVEQPAGAGHRVEQVL